MSNRIEEILVSIIIPCYKFEKYIGECIESALVQTHTRLEIIIVDDGSPDKSGEIADSYAVKDSRIKVIHKENGGVSSARNTGIDAAKGEYICFSDADDRMMPDYVEYLLALAVENDADMSITRNFHNSFRKKEVVEDKLEIQTAEEATIDLLYYKHMIGVYCKMFKTSFLNDNKLRFMTDIYIGEGFNFTMDCFQRINKLAVGLRSVYFYRRDNEGSAMTNFNVEKVICGIEALQRIKSKLLFHTNEVLKAWEYANWHTHCDMWIFIELGKAKEKYPDLYRQYLHVVRSKAYVAFFSPVDIREKLRGFILLLYPKLLPILIRRRKRKLNMNID